VARQAFFGKPTGGLTAGGAHISVYLVPVYRRRLVVFDVAARQARGRWLPWDVMEFGANPYETAAALADDWCEGAVSSLTLADVMSFPFEGGGWELAIIFRAELTALPGGDDARSPFVFAEGEADAIGLFDPVDLVRWIGGAAGAPSADPPAADERPRLLF
jgi:hypothetical protein